MIGIGSDFRTARPGREVLGVQPPTPDAPKVEVGKVQREHWGDQMLAEVSVGGEVVAIATRATDCPMPSWIVFIEAPDAPAWMVGTVERDTMREFRPAVRAHVRDCWRRMVDGVAMTEGTTFAAAGTSPAAEPHPRPSGAQRSRP